MFTETELAMIDHCLKGLELANNHCSLEGSHDRHAIQDHSHAYGCFYSALRAIASEVYGSDVAEWAHDRFLNLGEGDAREYERLCQEVQKEFADLVSIYTSARED